MLAALLAGVTAIHGHLQQGGGDQPRSAHGVPVRPLFGAKWFGGGGGSYEKSSLFISFSTVFCHFSVFLSLDSGDRPLRMVEYNNTYNKGLIFY